MNHKICKMLSCPDTGRITYIAWADLDHKRLWLTYSLDGDILMVNRIWEDASSFTLGAGIDEALRWYIAERDDTQAITMIGLNYRSEDGEHSQFRNYRVLNPRRLYDYGG